MVSTTDRRELPGDEKIKEEAQNVPNDQFDTYSNKSTVVITDEMD